MAVNLNPNAIERPNTPRSGQRSRQTGDDRASHTAPSRAHVNFIPSPESLETLIRSAVEALKRGIYWDRGTMLNVLA